LKLTENLEFAFASPLVEAAALAFVRDVELSLASSHLLEGLEVTGGQPQLVRASLPVNTPLFGRRELPFVSELHHTATGAVLVPAPAASDGRGWAEVGGEARVTPNGAGSHVAYALNLTIYLRLPEADRWGTRALTKMIEMTAGSVLRQLSERLKGSVEQAAQRQVAAVRSE